MVQSILEHIQAAAELVYSFFFLGGLFMIALGLYAIKKKYKTHSGYGAEFNSQDPSDGRTWGVIFLIVGIGLISLRLYLMGVIT